jgi:hypothetical protein
MFPKLEYPSASWETSWNRTRLHENCSRKYAQSWNTLQQAGNYPGNRTRPQVKALENVHKTGILFRRLGTIWKQD